MYIFVKIINGNKKTIKLKVEPSNSIKNIKNQI